MKLQDFKNLKAGDVVEWEGKYIVIKRMRNDEGFITEDEDGCGCSISDAFCFNYELVKPEPKLIGKARYYLVNSRAVFSIGNYYENASFKEVFLRDGNFYESGV